MFNWLKMKEREYQESKAAEFRAVMMSHGNHKERAMDYRDNNLLTKEQEETNQRERKAFRKALLEQKPHLKPENSNFIPSWEEAEATRKQAILVYRRKVNSLARASQRPIANREVRRGQ